MKAPITHKGGFNAKPPTVMLHLNKDFEVGGDGPSRKHPDSLESAAHAKPGGLVSNFILLCQCIWLATWQYTCTLHNICFFANNTL